MGGIFQIIQGLNEQQDFSKGLNTILATDAAFNPLSEIPGERFSPSQVCCFGNSRKSSEILWRSIISESDIRTINLSFPADLSTSLLYTKDN